MSNSPYNSRYAYVVKGSSRFVRGKKYWLDMGVVGLGRRLNPLIDLAGLPNVKLTYRRTECTPGFPDIYALEVDGHLEYCTSIECVIMAIAKGNKKEEDRARKSALDQLRLAESQKRRGVTK